MMNKPVIGLLGGTFDPIHFGHLQLAEQLIQNYPLDQIELIPCQHPPHLKLPEASSHHRLQMVKLAVADQPQLQANPIETHRQGPSYTIDTVIEIVRQKPNAHYAFIVGMDSFITLNTWHRWQALLDYCHFIVINRPHISLPKLDWLKALLKTHQTQQLSDLGYYHHGKILFINLTPSAISSSTIRDKLHRNQPVSTELPASIIDYIHQHRLYRSKN